MKLLDPEKVAWELADAALGVGGCDFLLVIEECSGKTSFGVIVHLLSANLEFDNLLVRRNDGGVDGLIAVLLRDGDVVFYAAIHRTEKGMNEAEREVASRDVCDDETKRNKVIDAVDVLVVFCELFVKRID